MTKAELEAKHLSDLHLLAADAGVERYRMLSRGELIDQLADGDGGAKGGARTSGARSSAGEEREERPARRRRRRRPRGDGGADEDASEREEEGEAPRQRRDRPKPAAEREPARERETAPESEAAQEREPAPEPARPSAAASTGSSDSGDAPRPRRRRRRRFGRRGKQEVTLQGLLLPPEAGRQALLYAESRESCTELLRSVAADIAADAKGPDPVALLIDPSPEELADWRRDAPAAEIVAAGQPRHANDALAQAAARAGKGEDVFLLVDSLTRLAEAHGDAEAAKEFFDAGRAQAAAGSGSLTVVAALERPAG
jgi:transcription termination factor Rho